MDKFFSDHTSDYASIFKSVYISIINASDCIREEQALKAAEEALKSFKEIIGDK